MAADARSTRAWTGSLVIRRALASVALVLALISVACSDGGRERIVVSAASSLTDAFTELASAFQASHGNAVVYLNFGGSSALAAQIIEGAPASVFASANEAQMDVVRDAGLASNPAPFTSNRLVLVVPSESAIGSFDEIASSGVRLVLAGPDVPAGAYARAAIGAASADYGASFVTDALGNVVSEEPNVRAVLTRVELGEADAGIVYATDAAIAGDAVRALEIPTAYTTAADYFIAATGDEPSPAAKAFVAFVLSAEGQAILARYGFGGPA